jgi:hypothetical protein
MAKLKCGYCEQKIAKRYGYLNYLKNNIHPSSLKEADGPIIEYKDGRVTRMIP